VVGDEGDDGKVGRDGGVKWGRNDAGGEKHRIGSAISYKGNHTTTSSYV
jgi:hypothetical protein